MRMLFDGKACVNGCTFCCSRSARWIFKLLHHLHVHLIVFVWWRARPETFGEELKALDGTFVHYFLLNIPLLNFQSATQLIRIFFSIICLITYCTGDSYVEAWFGHCINSGQYSHFSQGWMPLGLAILMQECL